MIDTLPARSPSVLSHDEVSHRVDLLHAAIRDNLTPMDFPLVHQFTPGAYTRRIFMPKGSLIISKIHRTEHQFAVLQGKCRVWTEEGGTVEISAPFSGVTKPGTRRVLFMLEDTSWITFHPTSRTTVEEVEADIIEPHDVPLTLKGDFKSCLGLL